MQDYYGKRKERELRKEGKENPRYLREEKGKGTEEGMEGERKITKEVEREGVRKR